MCLLHSLFVRPSASTSATMITLITLYILLHNHSSHLRCACYIWVCVHRENLTIRSSLCVWTFLHRFSWIDSKLSFVPLCSGVNRHCDYMASQCSPHIVITPLISCKFNQTQQRPVNTLKQGRPQYTRTYVCSQVTSLYVQGLCSCLVTGTHIQSVGPMWA